VCVNPGSDSGSTRETVPKSDPISVDTVSTTMTGAKEIDDGHEEADANSWQ
jgi:hypothetical protein